MMTTTWAVTKLAAYPQYQGQTDVVFSVTWTCSAADGELKASVCGDTRVQWQAGAPFTPVDQLTEAQILGWVFEVLGARKEIVERDVAADVEVQKTPEPVFPSLPWAPPAIAETPV